MTTLRNDQGDSLPMREATTSVPVSRSGWTLAAGCLLAVIGAYNLIHGFALLDDSNVLINSYLYDNLDFWGWAFVIWGVLQAGAGIAAAVTGQRGVTLGVLLCSISMIGWFFMVFSVPSSALVAILLNIAIIFGLVQSERPDRAY